MFYIAIKFWTKQELIIHNMHASIKSGNTKSCKSLNPANPDHISKFGDNNSSSRS